MTRLQQLSRIVPAALLAAGLTLGLAPTAHAQDEAPDGVVNYTRVDATVACAGATPASAMPALRDLGFASVINFRTAGENGADIEGSRAAAEANGLTYIHIPFRTPTDEDTETFLAAIADEANQPAYIHCGSANRVGAMWYIKRVLGDGWETDRAMAEAEAIGLRSEALKAFATEYVASR